MLDIFIETQFLFVNVHTIKQGTIFSHGCCKFSHSLISEGYVEFITVCLSVFCLSFCLLFVAAWPFMKN